MDSAQFYKNVVADKTLKGEGVFFDDDPSEDFVVIRNLSHQSHTAYKVNATAIVDTEWDVLNDILHDKRPPMIMVHMTRIIGYFSNTKNWNKSKLGELKDRQAGKYSWDDPGTQEGPQRWN